MAGAGTSKSYIFGLRIFLDDKASPITPDATIGLYNVASDNSQFRWINVFTINTTDTWKDDIFTEGGLKGFGIAGDYRRGGNLPEIKDITVEIKNSLDGVDKFFKKLEDLGITLNGLYCELVEIDLLIAHGGTRANETILYRGICNLITEWDELTCTLPIKCSFYKRKTNISTVIDGTTTGQFPEASEDAIGEIVPTTFGKQDKAKMIRTANLTKIMNCLNIFPLNSAPEKQYTIFPIISVYDINYPLRYKISFGVYSFYPEISTITDCFIQVVEGDGSGEIRKIESVISRGNDSNNFAYLEVEVSQYFTKPLNGNATATGATQTWLQIVQVSSSYNLDIWPCKDFVDGDGVALDEGFEELYAYTEEKTVDTTTSNTKQSVIEKPMDFIRLPQFSYKNSSASLNNAITIVAELFSGDFDRMDSFLILSMKSIILPSTDYMGILSGAVHVGNGVFFSVNTGVLFSAYPTSLDNLSDNSSTSKCTWTYYPNLKLQSWVYLEFVLPDFPSYFNFDSCYLLTKFSVDITALFSSSNAAIKKYRRLLGNSIDVGNTLSGSGGDYTVDDTPDFSYVPSVSTKNKNFYISLLTPPMQSGYSNFELTGVTDKNKYNAIDRCALCVNIEFLQAFSYATVEIYKLKMMFKKSVSIKEAIYTPVYGRIFNDTWGSRKTAADLIENPIDIAEHILRLQNWSEVGDIKKYGLEYSPNALINTGSASEGQLDHIILDSIKAFKVRRQILDFDDANSDEVLTSLCKEFFMTVYQNEQGKESIIPIGKVASTPTVSIALTDIQPNSISRITTQLPQDVFVNPIVNYNFNNASEKHDGVIKILHANMPTFDPSYVEGVTVSDAEHLWNLCHALWSYHREIYDPPSSMTNLDWIYKEADAISYLRSWLQYMGVYDTESGIQVWPNKRVTFTVDYTTATTIGASHSPWHIGMYLNLTLPFHTSGLAIQCQIEAIDFDLDNMTAEVQVIMYGVSDEINYYIQKTFDSYAGIGNTDWQNMYTDKATVPSQGNDVQNNT